MRAALVGGLWGRRGQLGGPGWWGALVVVALGGPGVGGLQRWSSQPPYTEANPGQGVVLPCTVIDLQVPACRELLGMDS